MVINKFALFLVIGAVITGIFWLAYKIFFKKAHQESMINNQQPSALHTWFDGIGGLFPVIAIVLIFRSFIFEPFQIPSGSMMRTLLVGDFLLVNKFSYGIKNPVTNANWIDVSDPKRGDIVVFKAPLEPEKDFIKRVIGLPGERVMYNYETKELKILPACMKGASEIAPVGCKLIDISYSEIKESQFYSVDNSQAILEIPEGESNPIGIKGVRLLERTETINGRTNTILLDPSRRDDFRAYVSSTWAEDYSREFTVPKDSYFVMGDNRDHSSDGRFFGFVPKENLVGKAVFIWISFERLPDEWPTGIRFSRIGMIE
ncbi:signal peptidase I [Thorsellia anophelis]|uniref:Signal peptidase I n=1 Tax=Thorsellia anophelis DSM 18579 TaxID=1123402 RepID=A0A1I0BNC7_9GAMM|nr:signal peptidase I [Thorsellia anophelis]SET07788.1 signal peptidase I [Thorsellia anophelis DSM 18579]